MDCLDLPSAINNVYDIQVEGLQKVSLDTFKSSLGLEMTRINDGLVTQILQEFERMSEVIIRGFSQASEDVHGSVRR